jgi:protein farnesyltransferase subunit beta
MAAEDAHTGKVPVKVDLCGPPSITSNDQVKTETQVLDCFRKFFVQNSNGRGQDGIRLDRELHHNWLKRGIESIPTNMAGLDASRPWFIFWISHSLELLDEYDESHFPPKVASFIHHCQSPTGGIGGGPQQLPHLAPTYAGIAGLLVAGSEDAYKAVDRELTYKFLMSMKSPQGGFMMHDQGETDMRGTYCAIAVASMLHILTDELTEGVPEYVRRCQTYEGGIAGESGLEAHGGYAYCGLAALCIMGKADALDLHAFLNWAVKRQMSMEGGFCGRTNKLVDSCYSFWIGALFPLLYEAFLFNETEGIALPDTHLWYAPSPLQVYVLLACQHNGGGLKDKPGKSSDYYHTCYAMSGVAATQHGVGTEATKLVFGDSENELKRLDVFYNVLLEKSQRKCKYFEALPPLTVDGKELQTYEGKGVVATRKRILKL